MRPFIPAIAIIIVMAAYSATPLLDAWMNAPYDDLGWAAIAFWLTPFIFRKFNRHPSVPLLLSAIAVALAGLVLGDVRALFYVALALSAASVFPFDRYTILWLGTCVSWMPVLGYAASEMAFAPDEVALVRLVLSSTGALLLVATHRVTYKAYLQKNANPSPA